MRTASDNLTWPQEIRCFFIVKDHENHDGSYVILDCWRGWRATKSLLFATLEAFWGDAFFKVCFWRGDRQTMGKNSMEPYSIRILTANSVLIPYRFQNAFAGWYNNIDLDILTFRWSEKNTQLVHEVADCGSCCFQLHIDMLLSELGWVDTYCV